MALGSEAAPAMISSSPTSSTSPPLTSDVFSSSRSVRQRRLEEPHLQRYAFRQVGSVLLGGVTGLALGASHGSKLAGLRFRAENAHRLPTSTKGWYLYHKSKNYVAMWAGLKEGGRQMVKLGFWCGAFVGVEESIGRMRRKAAMRRAEKNRTNNHLLKHEGKSKPRNFRVHDGDVLDTVVAGLATAGAFSAWNRFSLVTAASTARRGLVVGIVYGLLQDAWRVIDGRPVGYVDYIRGRLGWDETVHADSAG